MTLTGAGSPEHRYAAIASDSLRRYGFQFHPEVDDTVHGDAMISNFVFEICGCRKSWDMERVPRGGDRAHPRAGGGRVGLPAGLRRGGLHGGGRGAGQGAGSGAGAPAAHRQRAHAQGRERPGAGHVRHAGAGPAPDLRGRQRALPRRRWPGVAEPEKKRRIIGDTFIEVFQAEAERLGITSHLLAQGTIYPDTIETGGTRRADTIKTHHNRVPVIEEMIRAGQGGGAPGGAVQGGGAGAGRAPGDPPRRALAPPLPGPRTRRAAAVRRGRARP